MRTCGVEIMGERKVVSKSNKKIPSYVPIYNMIYSDIINGFYKYGSQLPSEVELTEKYGVSRNTLRQALTILREDGLIEKQQGKSSIITYKEEKNNTVEKRINNMMISCSKDEIDAIDIDYNFGPPTDVAQKKLKIKASEVILASNVVYYVDEVPVGHAFLQIPVKHIEQLNVDLNSEKDVSKLINKTIFEIADSSVINIRIVNAEENITEFLKVGKNHQIIYIEEVLHNREEVPICRCKFYFRPERYEVTIKI